MANDSSSIKIIFNISKFSTKLPYVHLSFTHINFNLLLCEEREKGQEKRARWKKRLYSMIFLIFLSFCVLFCHGLSMIMLKSIVTTMMLQKYFLFFSYFFFFNMTRFKRNFIHICIIQYVCVEISKCDDIKSSSFVISPSFTQSLKWKTFSAFHKSYNFYFFGLFSCSHHQKKKKNMTKKNKVL